MPVIDWEKEGSGKGKGKKQKQAPIECLSRFIAVPKLTNMLVS